MSHSGLNGTWGLAMGRPVQFLGGGRAPGQLHAAALHLGQAGAQGLHRIQLRHELAIHLAEHLDVPFGDVLQIGVLQLADRNGPTISGLMGIVIKCYVITWLFRSNLGILYTTAGKVLDRKGRISRSCSWGGALRSVAAS